MVHSNGEMIAVLTPTTRPLKREKSIMRRDIIIATSAAAALFSSPAFTQQPSQVASIPDFSGTWVYPFCCGFAPPLSGPGPVINKSLRQQAFDAEGLPIPNFQRRGQISWIGDYTNPILKPAAAEAVKKKGEKRRGRPDPVQRVLARRCALHL
jgi:hypothetical protein